MKLFINIFNEKKISSILIIYNINYIFNENIIILIIYLINKTFIKFLIINIFNDKNFCFSV